MLPASLERVANMAWDKQWFQRCSDIEKSFFPTKISLRSSRMKVLVDTGDTLLANYDLLSEQFFVLYPDVLHKAIEFNTKNLI